MKPKFKQMNRLNGKLIYLENGKVITIAFNKPFAMLQIMKDEYSRHKDYKQGKLLISNM